MLPSEPANDPSASLLTKGEAQYTDQAQNPEETCQMCMHYHEPRACDKVQGRVNPTGWCKLFEAKGDSQTGGKQITDEHMSALGVVQPHGE